MTERPNWEKEVQKKVPHWGTKHPFTMDLLHTAVIYDTHGRPLIEGNPRIPNPANVPNRTITSNFPDARNGRLANISAYAATTTHLEEAIGIMSHVREVIYPYDEPFDREKLATSINASFLLGAYMVLKSDSPIRNGEVPPEIGALAKLSGGLAKVTTAAIALDRITDYFKRPPMSSPLETADQFLDAVFKEDLQTGAVFVCPAPREVMFRAIDALYNPVPFTENAKKILDLSDDEIKRVAKFGEANYIADTEKVFTDTAQNAIQQQAMAEIARRRLISENLENNMYVLTANSRIVDVVEDSLIRLNKAQGLLNESLLRNPAPTLTLEDMK